MAEMRTTSVRALPNDRRERSTATPADLAKRWGHAHADAVEELQASLRAACSDAPADELLLRDVAGATGVEVKIVQQFEFVLAEKARQLIDHPAQLGRVTRALLDTVKVNNALARRVRETLHAAAVLRAQRELISRGRHGV